MGDFSSGCSYMYARVRMRSVCTHALDGAVVSYGACDVVFARESIKFGDKFHIWAHGEQARCDDNLASAQAVYSRHAIELAATVRMGKGCQRYWLTHSEPTAAILTCADPTSQCSTPGYGKERSYTARHHYRTHG